jgi:hypothetical protein
MSTLVDFNGLHGVISQKIILYTVILVLNSGKLLLTFPSTVFLSPVPPELHFWRRTIQRTRHCV